MFPIFYYFSKQLLILLEIGKEFVWLLYCLFCFVFIVYLIDEQFPRFKEFVKKAFKYFNLIN